MLVDKAYPSWPAEEHLELVRNQFIHGILSSSIQLKLLQQNLDTLDAAVELACRLESVESAQSSFQTAKVVAGVTETRDGSEEGAQPGSGYQDLVAQVKSLLHQLDTLRRGKQTGPRSFRGPCWECGKPGHVGSYSGVHNVLVVRDMTQQCLLGTDFLEQCHCVINMGTKTLTMAGVKQQVPLLGGVQHRPGLQHSNADALSRLPCKQCGLQMSTPPPGLPDAVKKGGSGDSAALLQERSVCFLSVEDPKQLQDKDADLQQVILWLQHDDFPPVLPKDGSKCVQTLWSQKDHLVLDGGVLYRRWEDVPGKGFNPHLQLVIPRTSIQAVLKEFHDTPTGGHLGLRKTLEKVRSRFYWPGQRHDVVNWCKACAECASCKSPTRRRRAPMQSGLVGTPMQRVAMDILEPLPVTARENKDSPRKRTVVHFDRLKPCTVRSSEENVAPASKEKTRVPAGPRSVLNNNGDLEGDRPHEEPEPLLVEVEIEGPRQAAEPHPVVI
eukprot:Em0003g1160a